jgi:hypothetical protein
MKPDELDRVLSSEIDIVPSPGFARSVMAAVRSEAAALPPIPFPWMLALPGLLSCIVAIVWPLVVAIRTPAQESASVVTSTFTKWLEGAVPLVDSAQMFGAGWVLLGLLLTIAGLKLTWHLAGGRV